MRIFTGTARRTLTLWARWHYYRLRYFFVHRRPAPQAFLNWARSQEYRREVTGR